MYIAETKIFPESKVQKSVLPNSSYVPDVFRI